MSERSKKLKRRLERPDDNDFQMDIGRCTGGTFVRIVHLPTGEERTVAPIGKQRPDEVFARLRQQIIDALADSSRAKHPKPGFK
jgi:hypothetical protein